MFFFTVKCVLFGLAMIVVPMAFIKFVVFITFSIHRIRRGFEDSRQHFPMAREHYGSVPEWKRRELRTQAEEDFKNEAKEKSFRCRGGQNSSRRRSASRNREKVGYDGLLTQTSILMMRGGHYFVTLLFYI